MDYNLELLVESINHLKSFVAEEVLSAKDKIESGFVDGKYGYSHGYFQGVQGSYEALSFYLRRIDLDLSYYLDSISNSGSRPSDGAALDLVPKKE